MISTGSLRLASGKRHHSGRAGPELPGQGWVIGGRPGPSGSRYSLMSHGMFIFFLIRNLANRLGYLDKTSAVYHLSGLVGPLACRWPGDARTGVAIPEEGVWCSLM